MSHRQRGVRAAAMEQKMDIKKIDPKILHALSRRGYNDHDIASMSAEAAFGEYCNWLGLIGLGDKLISALDDLRAA
ncbi:hypothetical protein AAKU55_003921 [Oxalobacteraceae bacterium GrIS 1.11]